VYGCTAIPFTEAQKLYLGLPADAIYKHVEQREDIIKKKLEIFKTSGPEATDNYVKLKSVEFGNVVLICETGELAYETFQRL